MHFARLLPYCAALLLLVSCGSLSGDPHFDGGTPGPAGKDRRIRELTNPSSPEHANNNDQVAVSGVTVIAVDDFDETANGKSRGTIYVQDLESRDPYSGLSLFSPEFVPGNLHVRPGDVLDLRGPFQENQSIGTAHFAPGATLPQLARPVATFRYERTSPEPVDIDINDLADYATGRKWLNMLVRVKSVTIQQSAIASGNTPRVSAALLPGNSGGSCEDPFPKTPTLTNELVDLNPLQIKAGDKAKSIVGVVTFFCNLHLSPRSIDDVQLDRPTPTP